MLYFCCSTYIDDNFSCLPFLIRHWGWQGRVISQQPPKCSLSVNIIKTLRLFEEIKPVIPKGNQSWIFIGRTDAEAETPIVWPPDAKNWLIGKDPDAEKDWRQEEKGTTEDEMVGWHHQLDGHEFEQAPGVGDRQGSLACCSPWGCRVRHNWVTELNWRLFINCSASWYMTFLCLWKRCWPPSLQIWNPMLQPCPRAPAAILLLKARSWREFLGSPVVRTPHLHCRIHRFWSES